MNHDTTVYFLGGSRSLKILGPELKMRLATLVTWDCNFIVGDADGADLAFQNFLAERDYKKVTIYAIHDHLRNNVGGWPVIYVLPYNGGFYTSKDREMAKDCGTGIMLYDGRSKGTSANIKLLNKLNKPCFIYKPNE